MKDQVMSIVSEALNDLFEERGQEQAVNADTTIYSGDDGLDSLSLVRLVTDVEMEVSDAFGADVLLASEKAMSMRNSPYRNVGAFVDFIVDEVQAAQE